MEIRHEKSVAIRHLLSKPKWELTEGNKKYLEENKEAVEFIINNQK